MHIAPYLTDLTAAQWVALQPLLPAAQRRGRPRTALRRVVNCLLHVLTAGCQWCLLPHGFPPWQTVYHHWRTGCRAGLPARLNTRLRRLVRRAAGKRTRPTAAVLASQTVRASGHGGTVGYDVGKKTKGRKGFLLVDTLGLVPGAAAAPANTPGRAGARALLETVLPHFPGLRKRRADGACTGEDFAAWVRTRRPKLEVEIIKRSDEVRGFQVLPKRWVVKRTFGWFMQHRRLVRDYEETETSATGFIFLTLLRLMLRRLA